jgi:hypothetical protein
MSSDSVAVPSAPEPPPAAPTVGHPRLLVGGAATVLVIIVVALVVALGGGSAGAAPPDTAAARLVPADALAYVNLSLDRSRPAVQRALRLAGRFPDYPLAYAAVLSRFGTVLGGGRSIDFFRQVEPWLGGEAALALLNTQTSTAGTLVMLAVKDAARARRFVRSMGAVANGTYRGTPLYAYPSGSELAFVHGFLVLGQDASVRSALDVAGGRAPSLARSSAYVRAAAGESSGRFLDAYASLAGVRRVLAPQGGVLGALGDLLYQPALQGVTITLTPFSSGARVRVHSALDPSLAKLSPGSAARFTPTLTRVMPSGSILVLDLVGLDREAPQVLNAGAAAGVAGGLGPLLGRLGAALSAEGVNLHQLTSIFHGETAVAVVPHAQTPALVIVARTSDPVQISTELADLQIPLAQLLRPAGTAASTAPVFTNRQVAGVAAHQLVLTNGLQLDYAVAHGLVIISTSLDGISAVITRSNPLTAETQYQDVLGGHPANVSSLVFLDFVQLLTLGEQTGLTGSARFQALKDDLSKIEAVGLVSTRTADSSTAELTVRVP